MALESEKADRTTTLPDLKICPAFGGKARDLPGTLEADVNGLRYSPSGRNLSVSIMYGNIKHAFFQPADSELITLLHFHLHNHVMVGKIKTKDVQFYFKAEEGETVKEGKSVNDLKNKVDDFVSWVNGLWEQPQFKDLDLQFEPLGIFKFRASTCEVSGFFTPTASCLVQLKETPFFVITLDEIEIVNLEGVGCGRGYFDMVIVFKDLKRDVLHIYIPSTSLDRIKEWLRTADIKYDESRRKLNWEAIMKTISEDHQTFINEGGWEALNVEPSDSECEQSDRDYEPLESNPDSDSEQGSFVVNSESEDSESDDEDSESDDDDSVVESEYEAGNASGDEGNGGGGREDESCGNSKRMKFE